MSITGILPAAGTASRLYGLPKFLLPLPDGFLLDWHIRRLREVGANKVWIGASKATQPFIKPYVDGVTVATVSTETMAETVLSARKTAGDDIVLLSMPDTHWIDPNVFPGLLHRIGEFGADVAIAVWRIRADQSGKLGMVRWQNGFAQQIVDKDPQSPLEWAWGAIGWAPSFWGFIQPEMVHLGYALQAAIDAGVRVWVVPMEGEYHDCGTFQSYARMCSLLAEAVTYGA